ncbi:hypothetical protein [Umezawaea sp. NPDC059074]|uniref:hypothetical protein n=1 Tax=Umezawaea sp. NPDC059074 TaxID=3346716 RepID=UPI0036C4149F
MTEPAETVLWEGRPAAFPFFHRSDVVTIPSLLAVAAFFAYFFVIRQNTPPGTFGTIIIVLFGLAILYNIVGLTVMRWLRLRGSEYVVTDRRVVVRTTVLGREKEHGVWISQLEPPVLRESSDGTGSITFGDSGLLDGMSGMGGWNRREQPPEFVRIADARTVRDLIAEARAKAAPYAG